MSVEYIFLGLLVVLVAFFIFKSTTKKSSSPTQPPVFPGTGVNGDKNIDVEKLYPNRKKS